mmetsp:Transcript_43601/g.139079  ORF Transcript_43601/g.139079 Transcript_43601/m.139079 type:complete len:275 (-) Transcript_43601:821-1645(-)
MAVVTTSIFLSSTICSQFSVMAEVTAEPRKTQKSRKVKYLWDTPRSCSRTKAMPLILVIRRKTGGRMARKITSPRPPMKPLATPSSQPGRCLGTSLTKSWMAAMGMALKKTMNTTTAAASAVRIFTSQKPFSTLPVPHSTSVGLPAGRITYWEASRWQRVRVAEAAAARVVKVTKAHLLPLALLRSLAACCSAMSLILSALKVACSLASFSSILGSFSASFWLEGSASISALCAMKFSIFSMEDLALLYTLSTLAMPGSTLTTWVTREPYILRK